MAVSVISAKNLSPTSPSSFSRLTRGSIFVSKEKIMDSRVKPDNGNIKLKDYDNG